MMEHAKPEQATDALPLFYESPMLLRFEDHGKAALSAHDGFAFASGAVAIPLGIGEFAVAGRNYPIVFSQADGSPLAIVGLQQGHNLFVERTGGWLADAYVPAYVRRYPFIVTEMPDGSAQLLTVDAGSDRFVLSADNDAGGERLFDEQGRPTATAQSAMDFCSAFHQEHLRTREFVAAVQKAGLLAPKGADMSFADGSRYKLDGFSAVDEAAFRALPAEAVADWHAKGWLDLVALHQASGQNWRALMDLDAMRKVAA